MRRILCKIPHRPTTIVCTTVDGGRATTFPTAGDGFLPTGPKPNVRVPHTDIFGVFVGQSAWAREQLKNEARTRKALGILFRNYGGRATPHDDPAHDKTSKITEEELDAFVSNFAIECGTDYEKYKLIRNTFHEVIEEMTQDELGGATQNDRVDKLAKIAQEEELDALLTNSFTTNLMIECEPKYEKRFRQVIEKVRKKGIQDDRILKAFELVTKLMSKCEPEYEKLLCQVLEKVCDKITQEQNQHHLPHLSLGFRPDLGRPRSLPSFFTFPPPHVPQPLSPLLLQPCRRPPHRRIHRAPRSAAALCHSLPPSAGGPPSPLTVDFDEFVTNLMIECEPKYEKHFCRVIKRVREKMIEDYGIEKASLFLTYLMRNCEPEFGKLLRVVFEKLHGKKVLEKITQYEKEGDQKIAGFEEFITNLMIECEPKYEKRFRRVIEKVREKMIEDYGIEKASLFLTCLMRNCEPEFGKLLDEVLEKLNEKKVLEKIAQDDKVGKIGKLAKLYMMVGNVRGFEEKLDEFVMKTFLTSFRMVEKMKPYFMTYEVIEKVAKKVGNENVGKIAEEKLDALVTNSFLTKIVEVETMKPFFMHMRLRESGSCSRGLDNAEE